MISNNSNRKKNRDKLENDTTDSETDEDEDIEQNDKNSNQRKSRKSMDFISWKKNDLAIRKEKICSILHLDYTMHPPSVTVKMIDTGHIINSELSLLKRLPVLL